MYFESGKLWYLIRWLRQKRADLDQQCVQKRINKDSIADPFVAPLINDPFYYFQGCMDSGLMMTFLHACHPHQQNEKSFPEKTLLIIDSCLKYAAEDIQTNSSGIIVEVIPKGATNKLHPLDIGVKSEFEQIVQEKWENRAESGKGYSRKNTLWGRRHAICFSMGGWCGKISNYMGHWCPTK